MRSKNYQVNPFNLIAPYAPGGDQQKVIEDITKSLQHGNKEQTILGVTGSGKTFMMASIIANRQKPTLILAHNKTLAAQLAEEFTQFFPNNAVSYFVSYYDYYQPESYIPSSDTYIEKQTQINEEIERLRNLATTNLLTRSDVIIVASVSAIYGLGDPDSFMELSIDLEVGKEFNFSKLARDLVNMQYSRSQGSLDRGQFRIQGDTVDFVPAGGKNGIRLSFFGDEIEDISEFDLLNNTTICKHKNYSIFPANPYVTSSAKINQAIPKIKDEMESRALWFQKQGRFIESQRIRDRVERDLEMMEGLGFVSGIENYSPILEGRLDGAPPATLLDFFPEDYICFIDESHITLPQIGSMYVGDRSRKENLINYGFRLPSAVHNRPLKLPEFFTRTNQLIYVSATPANYEMGFGSMPTEDGYNNKNRLVFSDLKAKLYNLLISGNTLEEIYKSDIKLEELVKLSDSVYRLNNILINKESSEFQVELKNYLDGLELGLLLERSLFGKRKKEKSLGSGSKARELIISEAIIRPTGLVDPEIILRPVEGQVDDILERVRIAKTENKRILITTLTKKFAEELDLYFKELGIKSNYIHFGVSTLDRQDIIRDLRQGIFDVLIGINLLREGLDIPEVGLVAIFDADKEGFLRSKTSLIQTIGRAARNVGGQVIMYADRITDSMREAMAETDRRRSVQLHYNKINNIIPKSTSRTMENIVDKIHSDLPLEKTSKNNEPAIESSYSNRDPRRLAYSSDQTYKAFEESKRIWFEKLGLQNLSIKKLQTELQLAIDKMDFEKATAIKDLIDNEIAP